MSDLAPQYGIAVMPKGDEKTAQGKPKLMLVLNIMESTSTHQFYLCDATDNFQDIAKQIHDRINEAGREARRAESGLVVVKGDSNGLRTEKQGRVKRSTGPEGA